MTYAHPILFFPCLVWTLGLLALPPTVWVDRWIFAGRLRGRIARRRESRTRQKREEMGAKRKGQQDRERAA